MRRLSILGLFSLLWGTAFAGTEAADCTTSGGSATAINVACAANENTRYRDGDSDTYPNATGTCCIPKSSAAALVGYVSTAPTSSNTDCNDADSAINPGAQEVCDSGNVDEDCDSKADDLDSSVSAASKSTWYKDTDGDTYTVASSTKTQCDKPSGYIATASSVDDCNDASSAINPGAQEICDASDTDEDCDNKADDLDSSVDVTTKSTFYRDADGDTYTVTGTKVQCNKPSGYATAASSSSDCDDTDATVNPGATEVCDSADVDENCNGFADDLDLLTVPTNKTTWYYDGDGDSYGALTPTKSACNAPSSYVSNKTDCNDGDPAINPGAVETCNSADDNCNGTTDEGVSITWYLDADSDGYGLSTSTKSACTQPVGYAALSTDCNDGNASINPGGQEVCDSGNVDEDCDGKADDSDSSVDATTKSTWYKDTDADGYGSATTTTKACDKPVGYVSNSTDCNDSAKAVYPGAAEVTNNGRDDDCDGFEKCPVDNDGDGHGTDLGTTLQSTNLVCTDAGEATSSDDCDDNNASISPDEAEICDPANVDENCNGLADDADSTLDASTRTTWYEDADSDTFGAGTSSRKCDSTSTSFSHPVTNRSDCDDTSAVTYPGAAPNDSTSACEKDTDGDGYGDLYASVTTVTKGSDCDDSKSTTFPGAAPNDSSTACMADADGDNFGASAPGSARVSKGTDCDDTKSTTYKNAPETWYDGVDADCSGGSDYDQDHDGYDKGNGGKDCDDSPTTGVGRDIDNDGDGEDECAGDCNDANAAIYAAATEVVGNGIDENCDTVERCYSDADQDGHADYNGLAVDSTTNTTCTDPGEASYLVARDDCDDTSAYTFPGAAEMESTTLCERDVDGDGYGDISAVPPIVAGLDCADLDSTVKQGQDLDGDGNPTCPNDPTVPQQDCDDGDNTTYFFAEPDNATAYCMTDQDKDGWGALVSTNSAATPGTDCDDSSKAFNQDDVDFDGYTTCESDCKDVAATYDINHNLLDPKGLYTYPGAAYLDSTTACEQDNDGDGYGDSSARSPITAGTDCNDTDATIKPDNIWYADTDSDTYGDPNNSTPSCSQPFGYVLDNTDCDDTDAFFNSNTTWYYDGDSDNFGTTATTTLSCVQPAYYVLDKTDCDDANSSINPAQSEICDASNVDENCNGTADDSDGTVLASSRFTWYQDNDSDLYGNSSVSKQTCDKPTNYVVDNTDCDDSNTLINPAMPEICDANPAATSVDENCDGLADDADPNTLNSTRFQWYQDADQDLYGNPNAVQPACDQPTGYVLDNTDCKDTAPTYDASSNLIDPGGMNTYPGAAEKEAATLCEKDDDLDGYGDNNRLLAGITPGSDCNDTLKDINPGAVEVCDSGNLDENCNGSADDADSTVNVATWQIWYQDQDGDNFGNKNASKSVCDQPSGYVLTPSDPSQVDCDDLNKYSYPGANELCDGLDNDCDTRVPTTEVDADNDRYVACVDASSNPLPWIGTDPAILNSGDCNNAVATIYPGAPELCNGIDDDCDALVPSDTTAYNTTGEVDSDADGFVPCTTWIGTNAAIAGGDCNDKNDVTNPSASEICDGGDNDCDGVIPSNTQINNTDGEVDNDNDGYVPCIPSPSVTSVDGGDCDDGDAHVTPGVSGCVLDGDGDGYAAFTIDSSGTKQPIPDGDCDDTSPISHPNATETCETGAAQTDQDCDGNPNTETCLDPDKCSYISEDRSIIQYQVSYIDLRTRTQSDYQVVQGIDPSDNQLKWWVDVQPIGGSFGGNDVSLPLTEKVIFITPDGYHVFKSFEVSNGVPQLDAYTWGVDTLNSDGSSSTSGDGILDTTKEPELSEYPIAEPENGQTALYPDRDADGYGADIDTSQAGKVCAEGYGYTAISGDCDDTDFGINPDAAERCDKKDNDCNKQIDETKDDFPLGCEIRYSDVDGDDWGADATETCLCPDTSTYDKSKERGGDCDDLDSRIHPEAPEALDGNDTNCDGHLPFAEADCDDDGSFAMVPGSNSIPATPLADLESIASPYHNCSADDSPYTLTCWGQQVTLTCTRTGSGQNPSLTTNLWFIDLSLSTDGYGGRFQGGRRIWSLSSTCTRTVAGDCDDQCPARCAGAPEVCDGIDNNCSLAVDDSVSDRSADASGAPTGIAASSLADSVNGLVSVNETDFDQDGSISCESFSIQDKETVETSRDCTATVIDPAITADCNNLCSLTNPTAEEHCDGFTNFCGGPAEGTDGDKDGNETCGLSSGGETPEDVYLVAYFPEETDSAAPSRFVPLIIPRTHAFYCDDPLSEALQNLPYSSSNRALAESCLLAATLVDDSVPPNRKTEAQRASERQLLSACDEALDAADAATTLYQIWAEDICDEGTHCGILQVTLNPADAEIPLHTDGECRDHPEEAITRSVWSRDRILAARKMVVEQQCERSYGMICEDVKPETPLVEPTDIGTYPPQAWQVTLANSTEWWLEIGRFGASVYQGGTVLGCWGNPTDGDPASASKVGGDCNDSTGGASRDTPEGPSDLLGFYLGEPAECDTCLDGIDNNCDGQVDCADPSCAVCFAGQGGGCAAAESTCTPNGCTSSPSEGNLSGALALLVTVGLIRRKKQE